MGSGPKLFGLVRVHCTRTDLFCLLPPPPPPSYPPERQVRSAFTCLHSLDNRVLHGLDQDPSLTVFCPVSAAEGSADVQTNHKRSSFSFVYPSSGLSFEDKLKFQTVFVPPSLKLWKRKVRRSQFVVNSISCQQFHYPWVCCVFPFQSINSTNISLCPLTSYVITPEDHARNDE